MDCPSMCALQVVIAQERMSNNDVYCFKKRQPHKFLWVCETRSHVEKGMKSSSTMYLQVSPPFPSTTLSTIHSQT